MWREMNFGAANVAVVLLCTASFAAAAESPSILDYIRQTWKVLTRSNKSLASAAIDPKSRPGPDGRWPVYVAAGEDVRAVEGNLRTDMSPVDFRKLTVRPL